MKKDKDKVIYWGMVLGIGLIVESILAYQSWLGSFLFNVVAETFGVGLALLVASIAVKRLKY